MPYPESCEYLWWLSVSVKLRTMTRGEIETIEEDDVGHLRISLLIVIGDLAFRVQRSGYFRDGLDRGLRSRLAQVSKPI
jgi:hypothetical protein